MARSAVTLDAFSAVAEPKRRVLLEILARPGGEESGEWQVNDVVEELGWDQPQVSKHLAVLREVGLVSVRREGRRRLYRLNGEELMGMHEWVSRFERYWSHQLGRIKQRAERKAKG